MKTLPKRIFSGCWSGGHVQGIAVDVARGYVYYSFTTLLVKTDLDGTLVGSVKNLTGHLGCITYDAAKNRVYGSLEYKHDIIGRGIMNKTGRALADEDAFYAVCFDCDAINRPDMDAETDGVMQAVYLCDVLRDYSERDEVSGAEHRYGCSGIDGMGLGPVFGAAKDSPKKLMIAYGIYSDILRQDNDHQVILQYDPSVFDTYGKSLNQLHPHHSGPDCCEARYFLYTGNTNFGIQNLEYDAYTETWLAAVYRGKKEQFSNQPLFLINGKIAPAEHPLVGRAGERGKLLSLATVGEKDHNGIAGIEFPYGQTGVCASGDGLYCFSHPQKHEDGTFSSTVVQYGIDPQAPKLFYELA
jgi:hypothetical protein